MSAWHEDAAVLAGKGPAMHALVIGVSHYTHLPMGDDPSPADRETFGLRQLDCGAAGALRFARWLRDEYHNLDAPCGSVRLLLSPSQMERDKDPELPAVAPATHDEVEAALGEWWAVCGERPDNVAVLYAAGHGIMITKDDGMIVLLEDFAEAPRQLLRNALDVPSIRRGMAGPTMAKRQFYFVDACQVQPSYVRDVKLRGAIGFDEPGKGPPDVSAMYASAAPDTLALGVAGEGTLFSEALVDCLRRNAMTQGDDGRYRVSATSLVGPLAARVQELAQGHGKAQIVTAGGVVQPVSFHLLKELPQVPVTISIDPELAAVQAYASVTCTDRKFHLRQALLQPHPFTKELPPGLYALAVKVDPRFDPYDDPPSQPFQLRPWEPEHVEVRLEVPSDGT